MRELVVTTFITLDGVMQAPGGPDEDRDGGFQHGGWSVGYWDDTMASLVVDWMQQQDAVLVGRRTYEIFAAHWPRVPDTDPMAAKVNRMPKYRASRTATRDPQPRGGGLSAPLLGDALKEQLGLELKTTTGPVEVFRIERIERPSEN